VYRSARPSGNDQIRFVRDQLGVTTIISLEELSDHSEPESDAMMAVNVADMKQGRPIMTFMSASLDSLFTSSADDPKVDDILGTLAAGTQKGAVLVHCALGRDRTGMIVALHRVINEHWAPQDAYDEWHAHGFDGNELRKIEFEALYKYFIHRACTGGDDNGCVKRA
jgi:protein tyrosine/serine phosphatase